MFSGSFSFMMTDTHDDNKKPEIKINTLVSEVFSWSLSDALNKNLYNNKVCFIVCIPVQLQLVNNAHSFLCVFHLP